MEPVRQATSDTIFVDLVLPIRNPVSKPGKPVRQSGRQAKAAEPDITFVDVVEPVRQAEPDTIFVDLVLQLRQVEPSHQARARS